MSSTTKYRYRRLPGVFLLSFCSSLLPLSVQVANAQETATPDVSTMTTSSNAGFTPIVASSDSRVIYVSSSEGSDTNDCLSEASPCATIESGLAKTRAGYPDHVLLKRGDVWRLTSRLDGKVKDGRSELEPAVLAFYGSSGDRPRIEAGNLVNIHRGDGSFLRNFHFIGLEFAAYRYEVDNPEFGGGDYLHKTGFDFVGGSENILVEDVKFVHVELRLDGWDVDSDGVEEFSTNFTVRRSIFTGAYVNSSSTTLSRRPSNMYAESTNGLTIEENVFDYGGWNPNVPGAGSNAYNHNIYLQTGQNSTNLVLRNNIIVRGSSHGVHGRPGGLYENNFFARNAVSLGLGHNPTASAVSPFDATARDNVITEGMTMIRSDDSCQNNVCTGAVWGLVMDTQSPATFDVRDNIIAGNNDAGEVWRNFRQYLTRGALYEVPSPSGTNPLENNIIFNWSPDTNPPNPLGYIDPGRTLSDYNESLGGANSFDDFMEVAKARSIQSWDEAYSANAINNYIRAGYELSEDPVDPPTDPVDPPTDPVDPPTDPVDPPTDPVDPPTDPVDPPTDPVDPPTDPVDPPTAPTPTPEDRDGDGVPNEQDSHPDDASRPVGGVIDPTGILREWWLDVEGTDVGDLINLASYPNNPDGDEQLALFEADTNWGDHFGARLSGVFYPPATGDYTFWIAGDDKVELWLSTSIDPADKALIAYVPGWTSPRLWTKFSQQQSAVIQLDAGQGYYIEALHKEDRVGDNVAVAWQTPLSSSIEVLSADYFAVDNDGDGVSDRRDAFPEDSTEWSDRDGDGVGDNADVAPDDPTRSSNMAPTVENPIADQTATEGVLYSFVIPTTVFSDADGDNPTISVSTTATWLSYDSATRTLSGTPATAEQVQIDVTATDTYNGTVTDTYLLTVVAADSSPNGTVGITREWWLGIEGLEVSDLTSLADYPNHPDGQEQLSAFEAPRNWDDNFGARFSGVLFPTVTGDYTFWIAGDDNVELWLSSTNKLEDKTLIANVPGWTYSRFWTKYPEQQSALIQLEAGKGYYIEALQKEGPGGDNLAVAWQTPDNTSIEVISADYFPADSDGDGVPNEQDVFPNDPNESLDSDGDGVGDNADAFPYDANRTTSDLLREWWLGIDGTTIADLTSSLSVTPDGQEVLTEFYGPRNWDDNYGSRISGILYPPVSGDYTFWLTGDDFVELRLSTNASKDNSQLIAEVPGWTYHLVWDKYAEQQSQTVSLVAGQGYYIEVLHKEGPGGDHVAVGWQRPDNPTLEIISGDYFAAPAD